MVRLILTIILCCTSFSSAAEIYKWYDDNGKLNFSDQQPKDQTVEKIELQANPGVKVSYDKLPDPSANTVTMYMTDWCGYCKKAKKYFIKNQISFIEKNIETSREAKREHKALGGGGIPLIVLNGKKSRGFSANRFDKFYQAALIE